MINSNPVQKGLSVSSRLLLDIQLSSPVTGDSFLTGIQDTQGQVELLAMPKSGVLYNICRSSDATGWQQIALDNTFEASSLAIGSSGDEVIAFATGENQASPEIYFCERSDQGNWDNWQLISVDQKGAPSNSYVSELNAVEINGRVELYAFLEASPDQPNAGELTLWWVPWKQPTASWQQLCSPSGSLSEVGHFKTLGQGLLAFQRSQNDPTKFDLWLFPVPSAGSPELILSETIATHICSGLQSNGYSGIFLSEHSMETGSTDLLFIDASVDQPKAVTIPRGPDTGIYQLQATDSGSIDPLTLFFLDSDQHLFVLRQPSAGQPWPAPFELGDSFSFISVASNAEGLTELFGFDLTSTLRHFWENNMGNGEINWQEESIEIPTDHVNQNAAYCTRLVVRDANGNMLPNEEVELYACSITAANVGGISVVLGPNRPVKMKTDNSANLVVYSNTEDLATSKLRVVVGEHTDEYLRRDYHSQNTLANASVQDIKGILPTKYQNDAQHVHSAVQKVMTAVKGQPKLGNSCQDKIKLDQLPDQFDFRFDVKDGRAKYKALTSEDSAALIKSYAHAPEPLNWGSFWKWLGDIVESAAHDIESAFTYVVKRVAHGLHVVIHLVIRGVRYVFSGIVNLVDEAFSIVTAIFSSVMVFFKNLFKFVGWLITDAGKDIWATKAAISATVSKIFPTVQNLIKEGEADVGPFIRKLKAKFDVQFDEVLGKLGDTNFNYNKQKSAFATANSFAPGTSPLEVAQANSSIVHWFQDKLIGPGSGVSFDPKLGEQLIKDLFKTFEEIGGVLGNSFKEQITQFLNYLDEVIKNPGNFVALTIKEVLQEVKSLVHLILELMKAIISGLLQIASDTFEALVNNIFNLPVTGFLIEKIYNLINPGENETPTVLELFSLFAAIPSTVLFRLFFGHAPFTEADGIAFRSSDLTPSEHIRAYGLSRDNPLAGSNINIAGLIGAILMFPYTLFEFGGDIEASWSKPPDELHQLTKIDSIFALFSGILLPGAILGLSHPPLKWDTDENIAINVNWIAYFSLIAVNSGYYITTKFKKLGTGTMPGAIIYSACGVLILIAGIVALALEEDRNFGMGWLNVALPLPSVVKFLIYVKHPISEIILGAVDLVCDYGAMVTGLIMALNSTEEGEGVLVYIPVKANRSMSY